MSNDFNRVPIQMVAVPSATSVPSVAQPSTTPRPVPGTGPVSTQRQSLPQDLSTSQPSPESSVAPLPSQDEDDPASSELFAEEESCTPPNSATPLEQVWKHVKPFVSIFGKVTTWFWGFMALIALIITTWAYQLAMWTADKDFREACLAEQQRQIQLSNECMRAIQQELRAPPMSKWHIADRDVGDGAADFYNWSREAWSICLNHRRPYMFAAYTQVFLFAAELVIGSRISYSKPESQTPGDWLPTVRPPRLERISSSLSNILYVLATIGAGYNQGCSDPLNGCLALYGVPIAIITLWCTPRPTRIHPLLAWPVKLLALSIIFATAYLTAYCIISAEMYLGQGKHLFARDDMVTRPTFYIYLLAYLVLSWYVIKGLRISLNMLGCCW